MKRIISIIGIALLLFLTVSCQSAKNVEKDWNWIYIQETLDDYNCIVVELSKKEGLDDPTLLTLSKEAERLSGNKYEAGGDFRSVKYPQLEITIFSNKSILVDLDFQEGDITTAYNKKLAKIVLDSVIETVAPGRSLEVKYKLRLIDDSENFYIPPYNDTIEDISLDNYSYTYYTGKSNKGFGFAACILR